MLLIATIATAAPLLMANRSAAQEAAPDLHMLLNLDLFGAQTGPANNNPHQPSSMLDQIRTLNQMGYLTGQQAPPLPPAPAVDTPAPDQIPSGDYGDEE